ncbi:protein kinase [Plectonema cf. radiosum LEGE 06105]|uniref:non-specific serine/threonine protein kinase n=1 Tax=Plectonema cf. radiosum LEGE 06105 TaxID=945769 RepID=A0A8J7K3V1_9CYAN|nr:serine/threonine-protein kinase [Plectonema radiosum]MBE9216151.1 protein kinase [Plectonema cf. radiosum LEGE 06105]
MIYCINPECKQRKNADNVTICQSCGTSLLINNRYQLIKPLRSLKSQNYTDVFEVFDGEKRKVLKVLKVNSPQLLKMFQREAFTLQLLNHPGIPKIEPDDYFTFTPNNTSQELHCLVMEKIPGNDLEQWLIENGKISSSLALQWLRQLVEILDILHKNHFFHRDIKPSNIILKPDGRLVLIDFGSVRDMSNTYLVKIGGGENATTTISGGYTPPEQIDGKALPQSDFYALGRTFVHLLTGKSPVELPTNPKTGKLIWRNQASKIRGRFADFIDDMMAPLPVDRPQSASQILEYLNPRGLLIKSILRLLNSPQSKGLFIIITGCFLLYFSTKPLRAAYEDNRGRQALMDGDWDSARNRFETATKLNPNQAKYQNNFGLVCKQQKEFLCAIDRYKQALELSKNDAYTTATIHYNLATLYEDIREFDNALLEYQKTMSYQGDKVDLVVDARNNYARLLIWQKQNYQLAIEEISKALEQTKVSSSKSSLYSLYKNLGWAYLQLGNFQNAQNHLEKAIYFDENQRAAAHCLLGKVLEKANSKDALSAWQKCRDYNAEQLPEVETWQMDAISYLNSNKSQKK